MPRGLGCGPPPRHVTRSPGTARRRRRAVQQATLPQPGQCVVALQALDVRQKVEDAAAHARLMVAPVPATWTVDVDDERALAPIAPLPARRPTDRFAQQLLGHGL